MSVRDKAERTVETGINTAVISLDTKVGESFIAACCVWSWQIKMTDNTDIIADKIPKNVSTKRER